MAVIRVEIVTPAKTLYSGWAVSLRLPGSLGGMGVLPRHAPLLTGLDVGRLSFVEEGRGEQVLAVSGGFIEVRPDSVIVLAETAELPEEIDLSRAEAARDRARDRLAHLTPDIDAARAHAALARATNRLQVAGHG